MIQQTLDTVTGLRNFNNVIGIVFCIIKIRLIVSSIKETEAATCVQNLQVDDNVGRFA